MRLVFPNSQRINRGGHVMKEIVDACRANEVTDLIVLHEHRGQPGKKRRDKEEKESV
jgi:U3 small nucleolar ribonucleoprotein protein IMP4